MLQLKNEMFWQDPDSRCANCTRLDDGSMERMSQRTHIKLALWTAGVACSTLGYASLLVVAVAFKCWRRQIQNRVWLLACGFYLAFAIGELLLMSAEMSPELGVGVRALGRYAGHVSFCWTLIGGWLVYRRLVVVFPEVEHTPRLLLKMSLFAVLAPLPFDVAYFALMQRQARILSTEKCLHGVLERAECTEWIYYSCTVCPVLIACIANAILYLRTLIAVCRNKLENFKYGMKLSICIREKIKMASFVCLFFVLSGVHWNVVLLDKVLRHDICGQVDQLHYYAQSIEAFQMFEFSLLFLIGNKDTRDLWIGWVSGKWKYYSTATCGFLKKYPVITRPI